MGSPVLYAYVDGADLDEIEHELEASFTRFVAQHSWAVPSRIHVVNERYPRDAASRPEDLPHWDLGLNMPLSDSAGADLRDIEAIAAFLQELAGRTKREFVIGVSDPATGLAEDAIFIDEGGVDVDALRRAFGPPRTGAR